MLKQAVRVLSVSAALVILCSACASQFPNPENAEFSVASNSSDTLEAKQLFSKTFIAHGGESIDQLNDLNVGITGQWKWLITKIQPLVTDFTFRVDSQERILPKEFMYAASYTGPAGSKKVIRTPDSIDVFYNGNRSTDPEVLSSTALTADAFFTFLLGPLALHQWADQFTRLSDGQEAEKTYYRIHLLRKPGFGFSDEDQVVLWIDKKSWLTWRVQITLEGHSTTKGAHVEVDYLAYMRKGDYVFPVDYFERVNAPISIDAHAWEYTGIDINRNLSLDDLNGKQYSDKAKTPATSF